MTSNLFLSYLLTKWKKLCVLFVQGSEYSAYVCNCACHRMQTETKQENIVSTDVFVSSNNNTFTKTIHNFQGTGPNQLNVRNLTLIYYICFAKYKTKAQVGA